MTATHSPLDPRWEQIQALLARAAGLPAAERDVFLSAQCAQDEALRQAVYAHLLAQARGQGRIKDQTGPVTHAVRDALAGTTHDRRVELLGAVLGDYRLSAIIGAGGSGTVYLAERADRQYSAQVAIKVVANTALNHEVQRRFAAERQILAQLNHPYIARLLDAGETYFDEPFLVMEYVHGEAIDRYCDNQRLTVEERLRLFIKVCEAVQYAHRNLIVHRDLKPGNILVAKDGTPKLLDFGIAKLLDDSAQAVLQEQWTVHTRVHDRLLTPEYASPEQIRGQAVTTPSDIYALGIVLYELLTGTRPYQVNDRNQLELERSICIQDADKPSQRMAAVAQQAQQPQINQHSSLIAQARRTPFKKLQAQLAGDLDAILLRALRKEPEHRYSSVEHLIEDLQRHLARQPVAARQGNRGYYLQRFIKRHTLGVISGTVAVVALLTVAILMSIQARHLAEQRDIAQQQRDKATQESTRAESVSHFMLDVFTAADPFQSQDKQVTAKDLLDTAAKKIETTLTDQPEVKARLLEAIGKAYTHQGQNDSGIKYLEDALQLQRQLPVQDTVHLATVLDTLGRAYYDDGDKFSLANKALDEARTLLERSNHTHSAEYLQLLTDSGQLEHTLGHLNIAQKDYQQGLNLSRQLYGNHHPETGGMLLSLAQILMWQSKYAEAEKLDREAVGIYHALLPEKHPDRITADVSLGQLLYRTGQLSEAASLINHSLADQQAVFGNESPRLISTYDTLAMIQVELHQWDAAEHSARTEVEIAERNFGKNNFDTGISHITVAGVLLKIKKYKEAALEAHISLSMLQTTAPPDHQYISSAEYIVAAALVATHHAMEAVPLLHANIDRWTRAQAPAWRAARSESLLGEALLQLKKPNDAAPLLTHAYEALSARDSGADADAIAAARTRVEQYQHCAKQHRLLNCPLNGF